jgi:hypothetical protein
MNSPVKTLFEIETENSLVRDNLLTRGTFFRTYQISGTFGVFALVKNSLLFDVFASGPQSKQYELALSPLLVLLSGSPPSELAHQVELLKAENLMLCRRLPTRRKTLTYSLSLPKCC